MAIIMFVDGKLTDEKCKETKGDRCPECGGEFYAEYGFCRYGIGSFDRCVKCLAVFNFCEDV